MYSWTHRLHLVQTESRLVQRELHCPDSSSFISYKWPRVNLNVDVCIYMYSYYHTITYWLSDHMTCSGGYRYAVRGTGGTCRSRSGACSVRTWHAHVYSTYRVYRFDFVACRNRCIYVKELISCNTVDFTKALSFDACSSQGLYWYGTGIHSTVSMHLIIIVDSLRYSVDVSVMLIFLHRTEWEISMDLGSAL